MFAEDLSVSLLLICDRRRLNYERASELCGCSSKHFGNIVRRQTSLSLRIFEQMCNGFGQTPNQLLRVRENVHQPLVGAGSDQGFCKESVACPDLSELFEKIPYFKDKEKERAKLYDAIQRYGDQRESKGMQQGIAQGQLIERINVTQEAIKMGLTMEIIARLTRLPTVEMMGIVRNMEGRCWAEAEKGKDSWR